MSRPTRAPISVVAAAPVASAEPAPESRTPPPASAPPAPRRSDRHERLDSPSRQTSASANLTLENLLDDATVTAIIVTPGAPVEIERDGKLEAIGEIGDRNMVAESLWQLANTATPPPPADNPVVEVRLPDGSRLTALFPPMTSAPVCATIRKAAVREVALGEIAGGADVETLLTAALASRRNILVAGDAHAAGARSGRSTCSSRVKAAPSWRTSWLRSPADRRA